MKLFAIALAFGLCVIGAIIADKLFTSPLTHGVLGHDNSGSVNSRCEGLTNEGKQLLSHKGVQAGSTLTLIAFGTGKRVTSPVRLFDNPVPVVSDEVFGFAESDAVRQREAFLDKIESSCEAAGESAHSPVLRLVSLGLAHLRGRGCDVSSQCFLIVQSDLVEDVEPALASAILETASAVFRHFGIRLVMIMQDLGQLKKAYPDSWESFLGSAECTIWMGTSHQATLEYLCKVLGVKTRTVKVSEGGFSKVPARVDRRTEPVLYPHQAAELLAPARKQFIATRAGAPAIIVGYDGYDTALSVRDYQPDPNYPERRLRAMGRRICEWLIAPKKPRGEHRLKLRVKEAV